MGLRADWQAFAWRKNMRNSERNRHLGSRLLCSNIGKPIIWKGIILVFVLFWFGLVLGTKG